MAFQQLSTHRTGDINFFSACMAIGIAPSFPEPVEIMQQDDGRDYLSFRLCDVSECGQHDTKEINKAWNFPVDFSKEFPNHPFSLLMDFIKSARGAKTKDEWIEKAAAYLTVSRDSIRKDMRRVDALTHALPESPLTYVLCFITNRFAAIQWVKTAIPKTVVNAGPSIVMIDGKLPKKKQLQLLSYL
jgi:hypothetical protein